MSAPAKPMAAGRGRRRTQGVRLRAPIAAAVSGALALVGLASAPATAQTAPPTVAQLASPATAQPGADWTSFLHDTSHSSYNAAAASITPSNLSNLQPVWRWIVPAPTNGGASTLYASPVVSNGVVYIGAEDGFFYAIEEATQQVLWSDFLGVTLGTTCPGPQGIVATATVANDPVTGNPTVYVYGPDGNLYALDAATGTVVWKSVVYTPSKTVDDFYAWSSPLVAGGDVYVGISSDCDSPLVNSGVVSFNQSTGAPVATWHSLPPGQRGASVWSSPAQTADGRIIAATGNGYKNSGQPAYDDSIVALDPNTLSVLDSWEVPPAQQIVDGDFGGSPTMFTATIGGVPTPMVGICNKNGTYYAFRQDALAAGPVWQDTITVPYPGGSQECVAAAIWDGTNLIEGGGAPTTIGGTTYQGSVQALDPAAGTPVWQTGLPGTVVGSPTEDGAGVVAAQIFQSSTGVHGVYLLSAATGAILDFIPVSHSQLFGQPVFAQNDLLIGGSSTAGLTAYDITTAGPPITNVSPSVIASGKTTIRLTGSGFTGSPSVVISGDNVTAGTPTVVSSTELDVPVTVGAKASLNARDISVIEPGTPPVADTCTGCLTIAPKPAPASITPNSFTVGASNVAATVTGQHFDSGAVVTSHAGISFQTTFVSSTQLNVSVSVKSTVTPGTYSLFVTNPNGLRGKCANCLTVTG